MDPLDDPAVVAREYASEAGLAARASIYEGTGGEDVNEALLAMVLERHPSAVLEVGCGPGVLAQRLAAASTAAVTAIDISDRMVALARSRSVEASVADVQQLPFEDARFDAVIAAWMLYHVPALALGLREIRRVLHPGGTVFAVTNSDAHLAELWEVIGLDRPPLAFSSENGAELLATHFGAVARVLDVRQPLRDDIAPRLGAARAQVEA